MSEMTFRRRRLPHQDVEGHPTFITACLNGSLSSHGLKRIDQYREQLDARKKPRQFSDSEWESHKQKLLFAFVDRLLDGESPVSHLSDPRQAEIVQDAFLHFANVRYQLFAFVVMPSHHHWLFLPLEAWALSAAQEANDTGGKLKTPREIISHSIQSYTATMCNRVRGESGAYWQRETFDHWARDEGEVMRIIDYIEMNPVKAGLASTPDDYPYSSARVRRKLGILPGQPISKVA